MSNVIDLKKWKLEKKTEDSVKKFFKDSLDNNKVKENYKLTDKKIVTEEERLTRIKNSIHRINSLMSELQDTTKKDNTK
jgi:hypothetical protein